MRTITKTFDVYTIEELKQASEDGYNKAIKEEAERLQEDFFDFVFDYDYRPVIEKVEEIFGVNNSTWSCDGYNASYFVRDCAGEEISTYKPVYCYVADTLEQNGINTDGLTLTGDYVEKEAKRVLEEFLQGREKYTSVTGLINAMCLAVLRCANDEYQSIADDTHYIEDEIAVNEYEFLIDGTMYND